MPKPAKATVANTKAKIRAELAAWMKQLRAWRAKGAPALPDDKIDEHIGLLARTVKHLGPK